MKQKKPYMVYLPDVEFAQAVYTLVNTYKLHPTKKSVAIRMCIELLASLAPPMDGATAERVLGTLEIMR